MQTKNKIKSELEHYLEYKEYSDSKLASERKIIKMFLIFTSNCGSFWFYALTTLTPQFLISLLFPHNIASVFMSSIIIAYPFYYRFKMRRDARELHEEYLNAKRALETVLKEKSENT
jgi:hypothetical protein